MKTTLLQYFSVSFFDGTKINVFMNLDYYSSGLIIYDWSYFISLLDSNVCPSCNKVLEGLESIDDETDALDITFVKINDPRYAKKYGVNKIPALVYFRKKFPSIYRGRKCSNIISTVF